MDTPETGRKAIRSLRSTQNPNSSLLLYSYAVSWHMPIFNRIFLRRENFPKGMLKDCWTLTSSFSRFHFTSILISSFVCTLGISNGIDKDCGRKQERIPLIHMRMDGEWRHKICKATFCRYDRYDWELK